MSKPKFVVGDMVQLNVGGPAMTVQIVSGEDREWYVCIWFDGTKLQLANLREETLVPCVSTTLMVCVVAADTVN